MLCSFVDEYVALLTFRFVQFELLIHINSLVFKLVNVLNQRGLIEKGYSFSLKGINKTVSICGDA